MSGNDELLTMDNNKDEHEWPIPDATYIWVDPKTREHIPVSAGTPLDAGFFTRFLPDEHSIQEYEQALESGESPDDAFLKASHAALSRMNEHEEERKKIVHWLNERTAAVQKQVKREERERNLKIVAMLAPCLIGILAWLLFQFLA